MEKRVWNTVKKETVHEFHGGHMTHPMQKKHGTHRDHSIKTFEPRFKPDTLKCIKF